MRWLYVLTLLGFVAGCSSSANSDLFPTDGGVGADGGPGAGADGGPGQGDGSPSPGCVPATCASANKDCGQMLDGCAGTISCGDCKAGLTCGAGGPNICGPGSCTPTTCAAGGFDCGKISDGCGSILDCGSCAAGKTCGGAGKPNTCGAGTCVPTTCTAQHKDCGVISDGCSGQISCGACTAPLTCGAGGTPNVCAQPCPLGCPSGYTCDANGVCAGGTPTGLVLDVKTVSVTGGVTLNGAPPTRTCSAAAPAVVRFVDKAHGYDLSLPVTCNDAFSFTGNVYPGTYEVSVAGTSYSNLPQGSPFIANPALVVAANVPNLALDVKTLSVAGGVTLNGAPPTRTCSAAAPAVVRFVDKAQGYDLSLPATCNDAFSFAGNVYPGTYEVSVAGTSYSNLPQGSAFVANAALVVSANVPSLPLDVKTAPVSGRITLNGAPPARTCSAAAPAVVRFFDKAHGYDLSISATCDDAFDYAGNVYPGTYEVSVSGTSYSNLPQGSAFIANPALAIAGPVSGLALDVKTVPVAGGITLNGAPPTRTCSAAAPAVVRLVEKTQGYDLTIAATCDDAFSFSGNVYPGTYAVSVEGTSYSNLPQGSPYLANGALVLAAGVSGLALDVKTLAVSGGITLNGAPPTRTCSAAAPAIVQLSDKTQGYELSLPVTCNDAFSFSGNVYPGTYVVSVGGTSYSNLPQGSPFVANGALAVAQNVSGLALDVKTIAIAGKITLNGAPPTRTCSAAAPAVVQLSDAAHGYSLSIPAACDDAFSFSGNVYPGTYTIDVEGTSYSNLPQGSPYVAVELIRIP